MKLMLKIAPCVLALALSACGGTPTNRTLYSTHQPVVSHNSYTLDLITGPGGLSSGEAHRLDGWFDAMNLAYGDRIVLDDPLRSEGTRASVGDIAARHGLEISRIVPLGESTTSAGNARVTIMRASANVPGCPDWSAKSENNWRNATSPGYGCAINGNLAAMVADPDHLLTGARAPGQTSVMTSNKAIEAYRAAKPSGDGGNTVRKSSTAGGGN
jgi:pilus assembly protein CpaD